MTTTQKVRLTALRPLNGEYGHAFEGQFFDVSGEDAESLISRGLAKRYVPAPPQAADEYKMHRPFENKMAEVATNKKRR